MLPSPVIRSTLLSLPSAAQLPHSVVTTPVGHPLCFDTLPKPYSRNLFSFIFLQNAPGVVWVRPTRGGFPSLSPAFATLTGTTGVYLNYSQSGTRSLPYPLGRGMCYKLARRGTSREALPFVRATRTDRACAVFPGAGKLTGSGGPARCARGGCFRVARGVRSALLSRVLAEAGISPVQADLQSVRLLHVLRGLHLAPRPRRRKNRDFLEFWYAVRLRIRLPPDFFQS